MPRADRACPRHFAVVQLAVPQVKTINFEYDVFLDSTGLEFTYITAYDLEMELAPARLRAGCSAGGELVEVELVAGWEEGQNLEPLDPAVDEIFEPVEISEGGGHGGADVRDDHDHVRGVADVAETVHLFGPIADVTARCAFGSRIVESDVFWAQTETASSSPSRSANSIRSAIDDFVVTSSRLTVNAPAGSRLR